MKCTFVAYFWSLYPLNGNTNARRLYSEERIFNIKKFWYSWKATNNLL